MYRRAMTRLTCETVQATLSKSSHNRHNTWQQPPPPPIAQIRQACNATRFPDHCFSSLSKPGLVPQDPKPVQIIHSDISLSFETLNSGQSQIKSILDSSAGNKNRTNIHRTESSDVAVTSGAIKDARAWMSAALAYQYDCWSECLKLIPHSKFSFAKIWLPVLGRYEETLLGKLQKISKYAELERSLAETGLARTIFELAISQPALDMP
ncbi:hypothetical protein IGI04_030116 [Brassica rapa subsp. trilocularis]|uniref:Pectinesterase inhibitor domain-containing protein n=1 Tax=Brassica rapa subsp. trilocularis TaxID=1813537 RepID=A0ABQ7LPR8_BRACM|nr:hypothetical protein IGI04_030116 [Brassica rapa subsp. trilocularis]